MLDPLRVCRDCVRIALERLRGKVDPLREGVVLRTFWGDLLRVPKVVQVRLGLEPGTLKPALLTLEAGQITTLPLGFEPRLLRCLPVAKEERADVGGRAPDRAPAARQGIRPGNGTQRV